MRAALALALALFLAGCADRGELSEGPVEQGEPAFSDHPGPPRSPPPAMTWGRLAEGSFRLDAVASQVRVPITIPNATVKVLVNVTFETGTTMDPGVMLDSCAQRIPGRFVAIGQTFPFDCGRLHDVTTELLLDHTSGELVGRYTVENLVCGQPGARWANCP